MKPWSRLFAVIVASAATYSILGCAAPVPFTYQNVSIAITSVNCQDCPGEIFSPAGVIPPGYIPGGGGNTGQNGGNAQPDAPGSILLMSNQGIGGTQTFTATVKNAPPNITWTLYPQPNLSTPNPPPSGTSTPVGESSSSVGTIQAASGLTVIYSDNGVPIYTGASLVQANALGIGQGQVLLVGTVPSDPNNPNAVATVSQLIQIYNGTTAQGPPSVYLVPKTPTTPAGLTNPVVTVTHGVGAAAGQFQFYGGVAGAAPCTTVNTCLAISNIVPVCPSLGTVIALNTADNCAVWEVGPAPFALATAVVGGDSVYGTISQSGLYTAPAVIPPTQPVVVLVSHLVPTVSAYANLAIN
jgi:hypothetical protein